MKTLLISIICLPSVFFGQTDTLNQTDVNGQKQGYWILYGKDLPEAGTPSTLKVEEGYFKNNKKSGIWKRYYEDGIKLKAVMNFQYQEVEKNSVRGNVFYYAYYDNGALKRKPEIGACGTKSNNFNYDESGSIVQIERFDENCNSSYELRKIMPNELDELSFFVIDSQWQKVVEQLKDQSPYAEIDFKQSGHYMADYHQQVFQLGDFVDGKLMTGREYWFSETMQTQAVRYFENGKYVYSMLSQAATSKL